MFITAWHSIDMHSIRANPEIRTKRVYLGLYIHYTLDSPIDEITMHGKWL